MIDKSNENLENIKEVIINSNTKEKIKFKEKLEIIRSFIKKLMDIVGAIFGIALLCPLTFIVIIINIINKDYGPIFYSQVRVGKNGKRFKIYKFRTMEVDADKKLAKILKENEELKKEWNEKRKLTFDPRITKSRKLFKKNKFR